jgi:hypothetical protein
MEQRVNANAVVDILVSLNSETLEPVIDVCSGVDRETCGSSVARGELRL